MEREDELLLAAIEDKYQQCQERSMPTASAFLDMRQCALAESKFRFTRHFLWGGYEDAERRIMVFLPDYYEGDPQDPAFRLYPEDEFLEVLRVSIPKGSRPLTHRDYLGSILALGIDRSVTGDILVQPLGADIVILKSMEDYLLSSYTSAGRATLTTSIAPIEELRLAETKMQQKRDTVASLRLDNVVSSAFNLSRGKAQDAIRGGIVSLNGLQCLKPDALAEEGDKITLRGMGKAVLREVGGTTRKDRITIILDKYI
jgi:RNA-binding protein YlmH